VISVTKIEHGISPPILSESAAGCESYDCKLALQDFAPTNTGKSSRHCSRDLGVQGKTAKRHTSAEFIVFLRELVKKARWAKQIHSVLDNLSAHKTRAGGGVSGAESENAVPLHADLFLLVESGGAVVRQNPARCQTLDPHRLGN